MNIFDDKHLLMFMFIVIAAFFLLGLLFIWASAGLEAIVLPVVSFPAAIIFVYVIIRDIKKQQEEYKGFFAGIWAGYWFNEFALIVAFGLGLYIILTTAYIKDTFFKHEAQLEEVVPNEYKAGLRHD